MTTAVEQREYLTIAEVALMLGVSAPTIRRRILCLGDTSNPVRVRVSG